jgi:pimeloyl-ACP methyl ester carboxylesterase
MNLGNGIGVSAGAQEVGCFVQTVSPADIGRFSENVEGALDMFVDDHAVILATPDAARHLSIEIQRYWNWGFHVGHLSVPCRIWHGADDVMVPQASAEYFHAHFPEAEYRLIPGGHFASLGCLRDIVAFAAERRKAD